MDDVLLIRIEERISDLEKHLLPSDGDYNKIMRCCMAIHDTLQTFASKRERFNQIFKRAENISEYVSPGFIDSISMDNTCEREVVLAVEEDLQMMSKQFEEIDLLSKLLDKTQVHEITHHASRLGKLQAIQQDQLVDVSNLSRDVQAVLAVYNDLVTQLSETFVEWDRIVTRLEELKLENVSS